jgi:hypothetical protein
MANDLKLWKNELISQKEKPTSHIKQVGRSLIENGTLPKRS